MLIKPSFHRATKSRSRTRRTYRAPVDRSISLRHLHALVSIHTTLTLPRGCEGNRSLTPVWAPSRASVTHSPPWWRVDHLPSNSPKSHVFFLFLNSSELCAAGFKLKEGIPPALEPAARVRTRGAGLRSLEGPKRFVLSVDDDTNSGHDVSE